MRWLLQPVPEGHGLAEEPGAELAHQASRGVQSSLFSLTAPICSSQIAGPQHVYVPIWLKVILRISVPVEEFQECIFQ